MSPKQSIRCGILLQFYCSGVGLQIASLQVNMRLKVVAEHWIDLCTSFREFVLCCLRHKDYCHFKRVTTNSAMQVEDHF